MMDQDLAMLLAIEDGDPVALQKILETGAEADTYCYDMNNIPSKSMVHIACQNGEIGCFKVLMEYGGTADASDRWGQTPIMYSITSGNKELTAYLLKMDPSLANASDHKRNTPLHCAVEVPSLEIIHHLLQTKKIDVNCRTLAGVTPLMLACATHSQDLPRSVLVNCLLEAGADVNLVEYKRENSALHLAVFCKDVEVVEILLQAGADPNKADRTGRIPLTNCILENITVQREPGSQPQIDDNILSMLVLLTQAGTNLNLTMCEYSHPLVCASFVGSPELVKFFMDHGSIPDMSFPSGVTPILTAVSRNQMNVVKHLLYWNCRFHDRGRISRKRVDYYFDPFELAIFLKYWNMAKLLLHAGYHWVAGSIEKDEDLVEPLLTSEDMTKWYTDYIRTPQSLQFNCIVVIRSSLGANITEKVKELHLPPFINNKILMEALLCKEAS